MTQEIIESVAELTGTEHVVIVELSVAQVRALALTGKLEDVQAMGASVVKARIKSDLKAFRDKQDALNAAIYDDSSRRGAKWPVTKDEFIKQSALESVEVWNELNR